MSKKINEEDKDIHLIESNIKKYDKLEKSVPDYNRFFVIIIAFTMILGMPEILSVLSLTDTETVNQAQHELKEGTLGHAANNITNGIKGIFNIFYFFINFIYGLLFVNQVYNMFNFEKNKEENLKNILKTINLKIKQISNLQMKFSIMKNNSENKTEINNIETIVEKIENQEELTIKEIKSFKQLYNKSPEKIKEPIKKIDIDFKANKKSKKILIQQL